MATYKGIQGYTVQSLASDPPAAQSVGQLWYNSASNVWKVSTQGAGAWSSGGARVTGTNSGSGCGTQGAMITFGGRAAPGYLVSGITQIYNGSTWSTSPASLITGRTLLGGFGTSTAGVAFGGGASPPNTTDETEEFDGSTWTEVGDLNNDCSHTAGCGTSTAGIKTGGDTPPQTPILSGNSETWNGTGWTEITAFTSGRTNMATGGIQTACLVMGGTQVPAHFGFVEEYNGTSWSEESDLLTDRSHVGCSANGTTTAMLFIGGTILPPGPGATALVESWNGTSWTEVADLATANNYNIGGGSSTAAINVAGAPTGVNTETEVWDDPSYSIKTVTTS